MSVYRSDRTPALKTKRTWPGVVARDFCPSTRRQSQADLWVRGHLDRDKVPVSLHSEILFQKKKKMDCIWLRAGWPAGAKGQRGIWSSQQQDMSKLDHTGPRMCWRDCGFQPYSQRGNPWASGQTCAYISPSWHGTKAASNKLSLLTGLYRVERKSLKTLGRWRICWRTWEDDRFGFRETGITVGPTAETQKMVGFGIGGKKWARLWERAEHGLRLYLSPTPVDHFCRFHLYF